MYKESSISITLLPAVLKGQWYGISHDVVVVMCTQNLVWNGKHLSSLVINPFDDTYYASFVSGGVFVSQHSYQTAERTLYIPFVDNQYNISMSADVSPACRIEKVYEKHSEIYAIVEIDKQKHLVVIGIRDGAPVFKHVLSLKVSGLDADIDVIVCSCSLGRNYICLSRDMSKLWEIEFDDRNRSPAKRKPYLYGDLAVICFDQDIMSVDKHTGKEKWKYSFDVLPTSIQMVEDKIYVAADDLFILDVSTGKELKRKNPGLKLHTTEEEERDERNRVWIHPAEDYIVVSSPLDNFIQLLSWDDLSCMHTIQIPEGYLIENEDYAFPTISKEKLVVPLFKMNFYGIRALMMIDLAKYQPQDQAVFMPMPEIQHRITPDIEEEHAYSICIDTDLIYEATGYAEVMVKELVTELRLTSEDICNVKTDWVDKKHNGEINIVLDPTGFDEHEIKTIEYEIRELSDSLNSKEETFRILKLFPTDVPPLKIQPNFLQKSEWEKEGEQIDIKELFSETSVH